MRPLLIVGTKVVPEQEVKHRLWYKSLEQCSQPDLRIY